MNVSKMFPISLSMQHISQIGQSVIFFSIKGMYLLEASNINKIGIYFSFTYEVQVDYQGIIMMASFFPHFIYFLVEG